jgi:ring-1,2-phenylacetyl-CoA epoxidase subunit PaaD
MSAEKPGALPHPAEEAPGRGNQAPEPLRQALDVGDAASRAALGVGLDQCQKVERARLAAAAVVDPEIPVLTIEDLGVLRGVREREGVIIVTLTPTYVGCPATREIQGMVEAALGAADIGDCVVEWELAPAWSTDDISEGGRDKLAAFGIAPPARTAACATGGDGPIGCPRCGSSDTVKISEFGSTPCKALWRCSACAEPFDYFKCL